MTNRIGLVTGAAGGIGRAITAQLAEQGVIVAMADRDGVALKKAAGPLEDRGLTVMPFVADVASSGEVDAMVDLVEKDLGPIDYLVNAAGVLHLSRADELSDEAWNDTIAVNATGVFHVSRAVVRRMVPRGRGSVVTVASNSAGTARTHMSAYAASKAAAIAFTKCLGLEVAGSGVRCNVVAPGSTDTPMLTGMWDDGGAARASIQGVPEQFRVGIPLRKLARPADVADAVLFLLSSRAAHITMQDLVVDGGATLGV